MKIFVVVFSLILAVNCWPATSDTRLSSSRSKRQHGMAFSGFYMKPMIEKDQELLTPEDILVEEPLAKIEGSTEINEIVPHTSQEITEKPKTKPEEEQSDEDDEKDEDTWPFMMTKNTKGRMPSMNFFPIMFGLSSGRSGGVPDGSIAIANSFSTGKKGMAVSNAFAGGNPEGFMRKNAGKQQD